VPPPDLVISELSTTTTLAKIGSTIHVSLSVTNQGGSQPDASSKVELHSSINAVYGDGDDIASSNRPSISKLAPGQIKTFANQSVKMPDTPGVYHICAKADVDSDVTESDETNNTLCTTTTITVQP
jgi:subtilase family serine protease